LECGFGLWEATEMEFGDGLAEEGVDGLSCGCLGELFEDIEGLLVFFAALVGVMSYI